MRILPLATALLPLLLAACGPTEQEKADNAQVHASAVDPLTYHKMCHGDDLSLYDIKALSRARVSDNITLRYLRHHRTVYYLNPQDIGELRQAGVSRDVIDYIQQTPREYASYYPASGTGLGYFPYYDPFWGPPYPDYPDPPHFQR